MSKMLDGKLFLNFFRSSCLSVRASFFSPNRRNNKLKLTTCVKKEVKCGHWTTFEPRSLQALLSSNLAASCDRQRTEADWRLEAVTCSAIGHTWVSWPARSSCLTPVRDLSRVYTVRTHNRITNIVLDTRVLRVKFNDCRVDSSCEPHVKQNLKRILQNENKSYNSQQKIFSIFNPDIITSMGDVSAELDTAVPRHELLDNTAAKHKTDLVHRWETWEEDAR